MVCDYACWDGVWGDCVVVSDGDYAFLMIVKVTLGLSRLSIRYYLHSVGELTSGYLVPRMGLDFGGVI